MELSEKLQDHDLEFRKQNVLRRMDYGCLIKRKKKKRLE